MLNDLQAIKADVFAACQELRQSHPGWRAARENNPEAYWLHDARYEVFVTLVTLLENAQLATSFRETELADAGWWDARMEEISEEKRRSCVGEFETMVRWFSVHGLAVAIEETLRAVQRADSAQFPVSGFRSFRKIYSAVLKAVSLQEYEPLLDLIRIVRNTLHTNGIFAPDDEKDVVVEYAGRQFEFRIGRPLQWLDDSWIPWVYAECHRLMKTLVERDAVAALVNCPRAQLSD